MTSRNHWKLGLPIAILVGLGALAQGCGSGDASNAAKSEFSHIRLLTNLYVKAGRELRRDPKNEEEFKKAITDSGVSVANLRVDTIDELFVSERDGKPLVVIYGGPLPGSDVIVHEQEGVNGMKEVGHKIGMVEEVDAARFAELAPNASK